VFIVEFVCFAKWRWFSRFARIGFLLPSQRAFKRIDYTPADGAEKEKAAQSPVSQGGWDW